MSLFMPAGEPSASRTFGRILMLVLPAGVVTFAFGAIHATGRWATRRPASRERGVLKWIFIGVLVVGMGAVLVTRRHYESRAALASAEKAAATAKAAIEAAPMIQFTFTSVELREEAGARWLAMDFVEQVRGDCQQTFRYDVRVPGFTGQTRKDSYLSDAKAGFAPVMHQRILWKLPDSLPQRDALALRDLVAKQWVGKSAAIEPGDERVLFKTLVPDGGTLAAAVGVRLKQSQEPIDAKRAQVARKIQLGVPVMENDPFKSLSLITPSELPIGEHLVGLLQKPDGGVEEYPAITTFHRSGERARVNRHVIWPMANFESNLVREVSADLRADFDGRVVELARDVRSPVFRAGNEHSGVSEGFLSLRSHELPASNLPPVSVSIVEVPKFWSSFLWVKIRVSAPPGFLPYATGHLGDGIETETTTSIWGHRAPNSQCSWRLPDDFSRGDGEEIVRQLNAAKASHPNGISVPPGGRVQVFSVTNQTGTTLRGSFELPALSESK
jgi:hypothetical protein